MGEAHSEMVAGKSGELMRHAALGFGAPFGIAGENLDLGGRRVQVLTWVVVWQTYKNQ